MERQSSAVPLSGSAARGGPELLSPEFWILPCVGRATSAACANVTSATRPQPRDLLSSGCDVVRSAPPDRARRFSSYVDWPAGTLTIGKERRIMPALF